MLKSIPVRTGTTRILPEELTHNYNTLPLSDNASAEDFFDGIDKNQWCVETLGLPGAWAAGWRNAIGVFFWSSDSEISLRYSFATSAGVAQNETVEGVPYSDVGEGEVAVA